MTKVLLAAVGCIALLTGPASAQQWSAESCKNLEQIKADIYATNAKQIAWQLAPILKFQQAKCGVDISDEFSDLKREAVKAGAGVPTLCRVMSMPDGSGSKQCF